MVYYANMIVNIFYYKTFMLYFVVWKLNGKKSFIFEAGCSVKLLSYGIVFVGGVEL